ncbi:MAG: 2-phosphosulfolactate phosphatase [Candidatus Rokuibacteriota bacterium]|nr:MAG: 2-phosphosulfolactate phosphatase [Candidatus Rokubacteria bacterium]
MRIDVVLAADAVVPGQLDGSTALVVDVLRASTTMITALAHGCASITPVADPAEARRLAATEGADAAVAAGERRGEPIPGLDLGNSPVEFAIERVRGRAVYLTTSNGTRALLAARQARAVGVAALVNVSAAARWAAGHGLDVVVVCAGERGGRSLEDHVCAGLLVERVRAGVPSVVPSPAALAALAVGRRYAGDVTRLRQHSPWARRLVAAGRGADVTACLRLDTTSLVPVYLPSVDKVVPGCG